MTLTLKVYDSCVTLEYYIQFVVFTVDPILPIQCPSSSVDRLLPRIVSVNTGYFPTSPRSSSSPT